MDYCILFSSFFSHLLELGSHQGWSGCMPALLWSTSCILLILLKFVECSIFCILLIGLVYWKFVLIIDKFYFLDLQLIGTRQALNYYGQLDCIHKIKWSKFGTWIHWHATASKFFLYQFWLLGNRECGLGLNDDSPIFLLTWEVEMQPCALPAEGSGCRECLPGTLWSGSSGDGCRQNP